MLKMYLDLTPSSVQNSNGCIMMKLYRAANIAAGFSNKDAPPPLAGSRTRSCPR